VQDEWPGGIPYVGLVHRKWLREVRQRRTSRRPIEMNNDRVYRYPNIAISISNPESAGHLRRYESRPTTPTMSAF
jgi:hypothetical protein